MTQALLQITIRLRLCDRHTSALNKQAAAVNVVWNYCNEVQQKAARSFRKWQSAYDLMKLTAGAGKELDLHAHTVQRVCRAYHNALKVRKKPWLRWRGKKALGWVPFNTGHVTFDGQSFKFRGVAYEAMHLRDCLLPGVKLGAGSFSADAKGRWYINVPIEVSAAPTKFHGAVGIDLGLKALATLSTGEKVEMPRFYRESEAALATAQRARKTRRARAIHAKARNRRTDFLHKASHALAQEYGTIVVGDVSPSKLAKTIMAKSIYDAGWAGFRKMLSYKAIRHGGRYVEVSEVNTSRACSACGSISGPKGLKGLGIREWTCVDCGSVHDRDGNAARIILGIGLNTLAEGARR